MSVISDYLSGLKRQYPGTQAVNEQLEELRDTLHIKTEEYQSKGYNYDEAARAAIDSLGDVSPLLDEVAGNIKNVYVNKLNKNNAILSTIIILAEFLLGWLVFYVVSGTSGLYKEFLYSLLALLIGICIWPAIAYMQYRKEPGKISVLEMPFRKLMRTALIGWLSLSVILFAVNMFTNDSVIWFVWPVIGISNWPVNIYLYHRQLTGGRYDVA